MSECEIISEACETLRRWGMVIQIEGTVPPKIRRAEDIIAEGIGTDGGETVQVYADGVVVKRSWGPDLLFTPHGESGI